MNLTKSMRWPYQPCVYVEETSDTGKPIEGITPSTCAFIGIPPRVIIDKDRRESAPLDGQRQWYDENRALATRFRIRAPVSYHVGSDLLCRQKNVAP
jgi:hypothetical protein